ncbi:MAG: class I SAM-dependent DNA methyltransferase, partial [Acetobacteraceae bacterium]|nr:class I SAM-dependent DNA methyltransferase [Acetobacteraceae bacterium]
MDVESFIARWAGSDLTERAAAQAHFIDLCRLLDTKAPTDDPDDDGYCFERRITKSAGGGGFADVWKRGHFALEYKRPGADLDRAFEQLLRYAGSLENPPILATCDLRSFVLRTNWTNQVVETHRILISELRDPKRLNLLRWMLADPEQLRPRRSRAELTADAAATFVTLAQDLRRRGHDALAVAHFVNRLVFCMFADKAGLLPAGLLGRLLDLALEAPAEFPALAGDLFRAMKDPNGRIGYDRVRWFNGGLFDSDAALPLNAGDIRRIRTAAAFDWAEIEPSIFGTLFERALDPEREAQIGAHYTDAAKIALILDPVLVRPLAREWAAARERIAALMEARAPLAEAERAAA